MSRVMDIEELRHSSAAYGALLPRPEMTMQANYSRTCNYLPWFVLGTNIRLSIIISDSDEFEIESIDEEMTREMSFAVDMEELKNSSSAHEVLLKRESGGDGGAILPLLTLSDDGPVHCRLPKVEEDPIVVFRFSPTEPVDGSAKRSLKLTGPLSYFKKIKLEYE